MYAKGSGDRKGELLRTSDDVVCRAAACTSHTSAMAGLPPAVVALWAFQGDGPDELTFAEGERMVVTGSHGVEWYTVRLRESTMMRTGTRTREL